MTPQITHATASDGAPIVKVPLGNRPGLFATIDLADFQSWEASGHSIRWFINGNGFGQEYVKFARQGVAGGVHGVARLALGVGNGWRLSYRNGDRTNLCRSNLRVKRGRAIGPTLTGTQFLAQISEAA